MRRERTQAFILTYFLPLLTSICFQKGKKKHEHITMTVKMPHSQNYEVCLAFPHLKNSKILGPGSSSQAGPRQLSFESSPGASLTHPTVQDPTSTPVPQQGQSPPLSPRCHLDPPGCAWQMLLMLTGAGAAWPTLESPHSCFQA